MTKAGYTVTVLSDCVTSYDKKKIPAMLEYYKTYQLGVAAKIKSYRQLDLLIDEIKAVFNGVDIL